MLKERKLKYVRSVFICAGHRRSRVPNTDRICSALIVMATVPSLDCVSGKYVATGANIRRPTANPGMMYRAVFGLV